MSTKNVSEWLLKKNQFECRSKLSNAFSLTHQARTISITSGKGGVGKTSVAVKLAKMLADKGKKTLLIDCDYNLSNTCVKLGLPINNNFAALVSGTKSFEECLYRDRNFHLLAGCNGDLDIFEKEVEYDKIIINLLVHYENAYDYIILDCPAGISKRTLTLNAYSDYRYVVVTPDKSSVTDSYSLMKILNSKYGINNFHLLLNKVSSEKQYKRLVNILSETVENYLSCRLNVLGGIPFIDLAVDKFDGVLFGEANSALQQKFINIVAGLAEEDVGLLGEHEAVGRTLFSRACADDLGHDVQLTIS